LKLLATSKNGRFRKSDVTLFPFQGEDAMADYDIDDYLFDLRGYDILKNAVDAEHLASLNAAFDSFPELQFSEWWGNTQRLDNNGRAGLELQNTVEAGKPFEMLIDHP
jgi:hypothetical protein